VMIAYDSSEHDPARPARTKRQAKNMLAKSVRSLARVEFVRELMSREMPDAVREWLTKELQR
jgi:hypothetical protein